MGEGGGQILRTSLALSLCKTIPFRIVDIRSNRRRPGLMPQHLAAVRAAAEIGGAAVEGAELGSRELRFVPARVRSGRYRFDIGTAGSTTLVLQTVLPALITVGGQSSLELIGGTHNLWVASCYSSCYRELTNPSTVSLPTEFVQLDR